MFGDQSADQPLSAFNAVKRVSRPVNLMLPEGSQLFGLLLCRKHFVSVELNFEQVSFFSQDAYFLHECFV